MATVIDSRRLSGETEDGSSAVEEFLSTVLPRLIDADDAMHHGEVEPRLATWTHHDPVTVFGALGIDKNGWEEVSQSFHWLASRFSHFSALTVEVVAAGVSGDLAYTVGYERSTGSVNERPVQSVVLRATQVYRQEDGEWKIVHRHADYPPVDQSQPTTDSADAPRVS
jgi:ketosteroid isomerase-like protein